MDTEEVNEVTPDDVGNSGFDQTRRIEELEAALQQGRLAYTIERETARALAEYVARRVISAEDQGK